MEHQYVRLLLPSGEACSLVQRGGPVTVYESTGQSNTSTCSETRNGEMRERERETSHNTIGDGGAKIEERRKGWRRRTWRRQSRERVTLVNGIKHTDKATEGKRCRDVSAGGARDSEERVRGRERTC